MGKQQRLKAWQPILTPMWVIGTFLVVGIIFLPVGVTLKNESDDVVEISYQYDGAGAEQVGGANTCELAALNDQKKCQVSVTTTKDMKMPVYAYYSLHNFYQNHRRYVKSRSDKQLRGETLASSALSDCDPLKTANDGALLNPCGLIANSLFNDIITLNSSTVGAEGAGLTLQSNDIAWKSDIENKFKNPAALDKGCESCTYANCRAALSSQAAIDTYRGNGNGGNAQACGNPACNWFDPADADATTKTRFLWQTYPDIVPKIPHDPNFDCNNTLYGVTNEHFIVWMRTAGLPNFRKLYGRIESTKESATPGVIKKGTTLNFDIDAKFVVNTFKGKKFLVISTTSWFGGKNSFLGIAYIVVGAICLLLSGLFFLKHKMSPRKLGDTRYLVWKDRN